MRAIWTLRDLVAEVLWEWGEILSALQHCVWGKRGEDSLCGTLSRAPNQATPPCGAQTNQKPTAEVKDWQSQREQQEEQGPSGKFCFFSSPPRLPNSKKKKKAWRILCVKRKKVCCQFPTLKHGFCVKRGYGRGDITIFMKIMYFLQCFNNRKGCCWKIGRHWFFVFIVCITVPSPSALLACGGGDVAEGENLCLCWQVMSEVEASKANALSLQM